MHTPETEHETPGLGATVKSVSERASSLVRLELELAALEVKRKIASLVFSSRSSRMSRETVA